MYKAKASVYWLFYFAQREIIFLVAIRYSWSFISRHLR
jgi:hypothetical protein